MLSNLFLKTLRDQRKSMMWWAIGFAVFSAITVAFYPSFKDAPEITELFDEDSALIRVFSGGFTDLASPEGFLNSQLYALLVPIMFIIFAISQGSGAIAGEEERGTLDTLLSDPTTRLEVLAHKLGAMIATILALGVVLWLSVVVVAVAIGVDVSQTGVIAVTLSGVLLGAAFGALGLALGSAWGKRGRSIGISGAVAVAGYFTYALAPIVEGLESAKYVTPFYYYIGADPLVNGLSLAHAGVLVALTSALVAVAAVTLQRRDLAV